MAIRKIVSPKTGKTSWQIDYLEPDGRRIRETFKKKKDAVAEHSKVVSLKSEGRFFDAKQECKTTLNELTEIYSENYQHQSNFRYAKKSYLENFKKFFGEDTLLSNIRYVDLETYRNQLKRKPVTSIKNSRKKTIRFRADASVNREMSCLQHLFTKAVEWELIEQSPFTRGRSLKLKENNKRMRFLNEDEIQALLDACPEYLKWIVETAILAGMRKSELLNLRWDDIRGGFIYLQETKTMEPRQIPVSDDLDSVFREIRQEHHLKSEFIFTHYGRRVRDIDYGFRGAVRRAGIEDFKFHDLRHTFASQVLLHGGSLKDIQELLGHKSMDMTLRYSHLSQEHKLQAVNRLNGLTKRNANVRNMSDFKKANE
jgi:integrase